MKKFITYSCLAGSLMIYLETINASDLFLKFIIAGEVPGTRYALPPLVMLIGSCALLFFSLGLITERSRKLTRSHRQAL